METGILQPAFVKLAMHWVFRGGSVLLLLIVVAYRLFWGWEGIKGR